MTQRDISFEVQVATDNRWVIDSVHAAQTVAMSRAQALLSGSENDAVRVLRETGRNREEVIFQQECARRPDRPITISPIDEASVCEELVDLTGFEARKTAGRVLRKYLDEYNLTALEVLHNHDHYRDLRRTEKLYDQAIHKVGSVQARALGGKAQPRIDLLYRLATQLFDETRELRDKGRFLSIVNGDGLTTALREIGESFSEDARPFYICAVLAAYVGQARDWEAKLNLMLDLLSKKPDAEACRYGDEVCAEILDGSNAVMELLGSQPDLGSALRMMANLAVGRFESKRRGEALLVRLSAATRKLPMPETRGILLERVAREISGTNPLTREDDDADRDVFPDLTRDLISHAGLNGGPEMSEALTRRARIVMGSVDSDLSADEGIDFMLGLLPTAAAKIGYLLDLSRSEFGLKYRAPVMTRLLQLVEPISELAELLPANSTREALAAAVEDLRLRVGEDELGREISTLISKKLDGFLDRKDKPSESPSEVEPPPPPEPPRAKSPQDRSNRTFKKGETIFQESEPGDEAFVIVSGEVEISIGVGDERMVIATLDRGEVFGEMALVDDEPRMATATTTRDTKVFVVPQEVFKKQLSRLAEEDRLISRILGTLVSRLRGQIIG